MELNLATADKSLDQITQLLASLLDVSRLQAGVLPVFPRPADLGEIIARCLGGTGPEAWPVMVRLPSGLPRVMVDPRSWTGHREPDRERATVLAERIAAVADRQRPRRQGHPARRRPRARRPRG